MQLGGPFAQPLGGVNLTDTEPKTAPLHVVRMLVTTQKTGLLYVVNQLDTTPLTAPLQVLATITSSLTALLRVQGSGVTDPTTGRLMVNAQVDALGTGYRVWFYYPFSGAATEELQLRRPELGNIEGHNPLVVRVESRGGTLNQFDRGGAIKELQLNFRFLPSDMADAARDFFNTARSAAVRYVDHNDKSWKAYVRDGALTFAEATADGTEDLQIILDVEDAQ